MTSRVVKKAIAITGIGVQSCVGDTPALVASAIRANIQRIGTHPRYRWLGCPADVTDDSANPSCCPVPTLDSMEDGQERIIKLACPAIERLMADAGLEKNGAANTGVFLALPELDAVIQTWPFDEAFVEEIVALSGLKGVRFKNFNQFGSTGVFACLAEAITMLETDKLDYCIVGGVDSFLLEERLELLDKNWRLKSPRNVDGFTPGEAGIVLMCERLDTAIARGAKIYATVDVMGQGIENNIFHSNKSSTAKGLCDAIRGVMEAKLLGEDHVFNYVYCDLNGESYSAEEWGIVKSRLGVQFDETKRLSHHASSCGELGAATGAMLMTLAAANLSLGLQDDDHALLWAGADNGQRVAMTLKRYG